MKVEETVAMRSLVLAAGLAVAMSTGAAFAADLDDDGPPPYRRGSAYDDPRYADIYKYPDRPPPPYAGKYPPPRAVYKDDDEDDYGPPRRYAYPDRGPAYARHCVPRAEIKHRLLREGWHDFHDPDLRGDLANVRARRPSGRLFELTVDRCSGEIVSARPLEPRPFFGPYAYGPPRRWERY